MGATVEAPAQLSPVAVDCGWCGCQFLSRGKRHTVVRCPRCRHAVRVKRPPILGAQPLPAPVMVVPVAAVPPLACAPDASDDEDDDDDSPTYMDDGHHHLVLAEWTSDGRLIPGIDHAGLAAHRYQLDLDALEEGRCPVVVTRGHNPGPCCGAATCAFGTIRICDRHHWALATPLNR